MRRLCVTIGQTSVNENTTSLERVLYLCLTLDWRWSDVLLASTFTRGKNAHIFEHAKNVRTQKMNDVHQAFSSNHQRALTHAQRITTHWPKFHGYIIWKLELYVLFIHFFRLCGGNYTCYSGDSHLNQRKWHSGFKAVYWTVILTFYEHKTMKALHK